jgi:hypothetical protein
LNFHAGKAIGRRQRGYAEFSRELNRLQANKTGEADAVVRTQGFGSAFR